MTTNHQDALRMALKKAIFAIPDEQLISRDIIIHAIDSVILSAPLPKDAQEAFEQKYARPDPANDCAVQYWRGQMQAFLDGAAWHSLSPSVCPVSQEGKRTPTAWMVRREEDGHVFGIYGNEQDARHTQAQWGGRIVLLDERDAIRLLQAPSFAKGARHPQELEKATTARSQEDVRKEAYHELYAALRNMHWSDGKLAVIEAKDLKLGVQTYSGELLDASIRSLQAQGAWRIGSPPEKGWYETKRDVDEIEVTLWWNGKRWKASPHSPEGIWLDERRKYRPAAIRSLQAQGEKA